MGKIIALLVFVALGYGGYVLITSATKEAPKAGMDGYAGQLKRGEERAQAVMRESNVVLARGAVERYRGEKGALPSSLQDCVTQGISSGCRKGWLTASTGAVSVQPRMDEAKAFAYALSFSPSGPI
jgi:hypothetical protein